MKTNTIKSAILALALLWCAPSWAILISLEPASQLAMPGDTVTLELTVSGLGDGIAPSLGAFDIDLSFDDGALDFLGATFGDGLNDPLDPLTTLFQGLSSGVGLINIAEVSLLADPGDPTPLDLWQSGSFVLASLDFLVTDLPPGSSTTVGFGSVLLGDGFGDPFTDFELEDAVIRNVVPEPMTLLLLGAGLMGIGAARRR